MLLVLDNIVFSLQNAGGISTYWFEILSRLIRDRHDLRFISRESENIVAKNLNLPKESVISSGYTNLLIDRLSNVSFSNTNDKFIFHSSYNRVTHNAHAKQVVTIHDFVHEKFYSGFRKRVHSYQKSKAIRNADMIITVSENTKKDLMFFFPEIPSEKIRVIYNGVSDDFYPIQTIFESQHKALLFIGSRQRYKNFEFVVDLVSRLPEFCLDIVGSKLSDSELANLESLIPGRWRLHSNVDNITLNQLYNKSYALVYPSSYEGFGIPLLEAMKTGLPFIALNNSSIPEVAGESGILLPELDILEFKKAVLIIEQKREQLADLGYQQVQKFSWEKCYQETLEVYKELFYS